MAELQLASPARSQEPPATDSSSYLTVATGLLFPTTRYLELGRRRRRCLGRSGLWRGGGERRLNHRDWDASLLRCLGGVRGCRSGGGGGGGGGRGAEAEDGEGALLEGENSLGHAAAREEPPHGESLRTARRASIERQASVFSLSLCFLESQACPESVRSKNDGAEDRGNGSIFNLVFSFIFLRIKRALSSLVQGRFLCTAPNLKIYQPKTTSAGLTFLAW